MSDSASDALVFFGATGNLAYKKICGVFPVVRREARNLDWLFSGAESFRKSFGMMAGRLGFRHTYCHETGVLPGVQQCQSCQNGRELGFPG